MTNARADSLPLSVSQEETLIEAFRRRDRAAFDSLYDTCHRPLLSFCIRLTGSREAGEDLLQETFVAAFHSAPTFRPGARVLPWLLGIAVRKARDLRRKNAPATVPHLEETDEIASGQSTEESIVERLAYEAALQTLSEKHRVAFLLVVGGQLTHAEAARILHCPAGTVKWRVAEAMRRLRTALTEERIS
ncbi:MAG: RNA polymerase sigma factor [Armatimonas sp.]